MVPAKIQEKLLEFGNQLAQIGLVHYSPQQRTGYSVCIKME